MDDNPTTSNKNRFNENEKLEFGEPLEAFNSDTKAILNQQIRHSIHQMVVSDDAEAND